MDEVLLTVIFLGVLLMLRFLLFRIPQPARLYISMISGVLLLVLTWVFATDSKTALKIFMTILVLSSLYKAFTDYRKSREPGK